MNCSRPDLPVHHQLPEFTQTHVNQELPDVQAELGKGTRTRDQIANIHWIVGKAREFQKNIYFCFTKDHNQLWKTLKVMEYQTTLPAS